MPAIVPKYPIILSVVAAIATLALKALAYGLTGSVSLLSDAAESGVNLTAALMALFSLWYASQPVDDSHTYGHEKIEFFSSGLEGTLILAASGLIAWYAVHRLVEPTDLQDIGPGVLLECVAAAVNLAVAVLLLRVGKDTESIVLEADGKHLLTDVWTSVAIVAGLLLVGATGFHLLDPLIALLIAVYICWTGIDLVRRSFNGLMDHSLPMEEQTKVRSAIAAQLEPGTTFHALRTRKSGAHRFADFHLLVPGRQSVQQAHDLSERIEAAVRAALPGIEVTVHIEPIEEKAAWDDSPLLPIERIRRHDSQ
jgi:cation diffusion facilitator family transporter